MPVDRFIRLTIVRTVQHRSFRYRFYPTPEQESLLRRTFGCCRLVYNKALEQRIAAWKGDKVVLRYPQQSRALTQWKKTEELSFLREVSCVPLQQAIAHLSLAYERFFRKLARFPAFKRKHNGGSAEFTSNAFRIKGGELWLAKMSTPLAVRWSRPLPKGAKPKLAAVSVDKAGRWHVSLICEDSSVRPLKRVKAAVGIDLGLTTLATFSTGERIANPDFDGAERARKRTLGRRYARTQRGSKNREKARLKLARLYARVADRRRDHLHKLSTRLVRENQTIVMETLNIRGMVHNRSVARAINDAGWGELARQLKYKCRWYGRTLVKIDQFYPSSKTCSECGLIRRALRRDVRTWRCECGAEHDRDHNAAKNILAAGLAASGCGSGVRQRALRSAVQPEKKQQFWIAKSRSQPIGCVVMSSPA